jgi:N-acyl-D-amino-acid deacylase
MLRQRTLTLVSACVAALVVSTLVRGAAPAPRKPSSTLIVDAVLVDGSGGARRPGAVRLRGDRVAEVGDLRAAAGETVVDARGLVLAPGFIDTHSHGDRGLFEHRDALAA